MPHVLVAYTDDEPGVLNRVASLFRRRAFNIHSLTVGPTEQSGVSRMTIVVDTDAQGAARAQANLEKLLNVQKVENLSARPSVVRDLVLLRVARKLDVDAETTLAAATNRFIKRFLAVEKELGDRKMEDTPPGELDAIWNRIKTS